MTDRELMQQALEALEAWNYLENPKPDANVIAALRAAIEQAQEPVAWRIGMTDRELMQHALEALEANRRTHYYCEDSWYSCPKHEDGCANEAEGNECNCGADKANAEIDYVTAAIKEALAQPEQEFIEHHVDGEGWSEWVCPDPKGYLMKCCDCGLVHEAEFGVVRYKSEAEREDCEPVDDPNLQAVFRMRRSERWSPEDTAHRAGGMSMAQPEQGPMKHGGRPMTLRECMEAEEPAQPEQEPVACQYAKDVAMPEYRCATKCQYAQPEQEPVAWIDEFGNVFPLGAQRGPKHLNEPMKPLYTTPPQRKPLTNGEIYTAYITATNQTLRATDERLAFAFARAIEAAHGIKGEA